jgi:hypothetical protein
MAAVKATTNAATNAAAKATANAAALKLAPITTITDVTDYLGKARGDILETVKEAIITGKEKVNEFGEALYQQTFATTTAYGPSSTAVSGIKKLAAYIIGIFIILFVISLFIHFFIVPIYSLQPGNPGIINIPLADKGVLFWNDSGDYPTSQSNDGRIPNDKLPISTVINNYTFIVDLFIYNPMQFSSTGNPRILLSRGGVERLNPRQGDTILTVLSSYNFAVALKPNTNDLIVSVLNANNHSEDIIIDNVPVQKTFRLGVVIMENAMEVYINGKLLKTRKYDTTPMDVKKDVISRSSTIAKMKNLKIWNNVLNSHQIYSAEPPMPKDADFNAPQIPSSSGCSSSSSSGGTSGPSMPSF